ncbi:synaptic vesicle glycoprotein 2C-like isoform X2 [Vespula squamosa]|uniref:Synaptic vesicle glycoprotein 2C-like isoform X2 n=1 Tax=Vespula squamosa TaxID=30214 RepID=A0ABD2B9I7_VESSQ
MVEKDIEMKQSSIQISTDASSEIDLEQYVQLALDETGSLSRYFFVYRISYITLRTCSLPLGFDKFNLKMMALYSLNRAGLR